MTSIRLHSYRTGGAAGGGEAAQLALAMQIKVGAFLGAEEFVPVRPAHLAADAQSFREFGVGYLRSTAAGGGGSQSPRRLNPADPDRPGVLGQHAIWHERTRGINAALEEMGTHMPLTCFNYQLLDKPYSSEHLAGGDAGTMIWANSICGAGSNFRGGSGRPRCRQHGMDAKVRHPPGFAAAARKFAKPAARACPQMSKLPAPTATAKSALRVAAG